MNDFQTWFTERARYLLPDGTPVIARYWALGTQPHWWFVEARADGHLGLLLAAVLPDGSMWNYIPWPDRLNPKVCKPQRSDLTIADLRPVARPHALRDSIAQGGRYLLALWCALALEGWCDLAGFVTACPAA